jgi:hypothetical protein
MGKRLGHNLVTCDLSGWVCWSDEVRKTWDGLIVHKDFFEKRHPQDFVRGGLDDQSVAIERPEPTDVFVEDAYPDGVSSDDL